MFKKFACAAALLGAVVAMPAGATAIDNFTVTFRRGEFMFSLPASPVLSSGDAESGFAFYEFPELIFNGTDQGSEPVFFYNAATSLDLDVFGDADFAGDQLYTGDETAPTFVLGTYDLTFLIDGASPATLVISSSVPEPASWAMLIAGFGVIGSGLRRRNQQVRATAA